jgi:hypothetical protein
MLSLNSKHVQHVKIYPPCNFEVNVTHLGTIPARFGLIWFSGFRGEDLNVIFYQNMPNLHKRYISAERKMSQKNTEYVKLLLVITFTSKLQGG